MASNLRALIFAVVVSAPFLYYGIHELTQLKKLCGVDYVDGLVPFPVSYLIYMSVLLAMAIQIHKRKIFDHRMTLFLFSVIILLTIIFEIEIISRKIKRTEFIISSFQVNTIKNDIWGIPLLIYFLIIEGGDHDISRAFPPILDICDGIAMLTLEQDETCSEWVHVMIFLAVITYFISSFLEIYHLKHQDGTFLSKRRVNLTQLITSFLFLVLRLALFAYNPRELGFIIKSIARLYYHRKTFLNQRRKQKIILVPTTKISTEESALLDSQKRNLILYDVYVNNENSEMQKNDEVRIAIDLGSVCHKPCPNKNRSQSF